MPTRSNVTCRLNNNYKQALKGRFAAHGARIYEKQCKSQHDDGFITDIGKGDITCCGIDELDFQVLNENWIESEFLQNLSSKDWNSLIACYIQGSLDNVDERILIIGIPVKTGTSSMYNVDFYKRLRVTLNEFGFRELCKPYKNRNSGNIIVVLSGQVPE